MQQSLYGICTFNARCRTREYGQALKPKWEKMYKKHVNIRTNKLFLGLISRWGHATLSRSSDIHSPFALLILLPTWGKFCSCRPWSTNCDIIFREEFACKTNRNFQAIRIAVNPDGNLYLNIFVLKDDLKCYLIPLLRHTERWADTRITLLFVPLHGLHSHTISKLKSIGSADLTSWRQQNPCPLSLLPFPRDANIFTLVLISVLLIDAMIEWMCAWKKTASLATLHSSHTAGGGEVRRGNNFLIKIPKPKEGPGLQQSRELC